MLNYRLPSLSLIIVFAFSFALAQTSDEKIKENQKQQIALLEQIAKDAEGLRLAENRALVSAKLGDGFWKHDEKRARDFFQASVNELIAAQTQAEANKKQYGNLYSLVNGVSPRFEILMMIVEHDAEFALDAFYKSRSAKVAQALTDTNEKKKAENQQFTYSEINFEQTLINRVSEQSPQRALKLIRESLKKGISYEAFGLIEKIRTKDLEVANQIAAEVADKLLSADFEKDTQSFSLTASFVAEYGKKSETPEKAVRIDEKILRELTLKVAKSILDSEEDGYYEIEYILPIIEKHAPETVAALKQKKAKLDKNSKREEYEAYNKFIESNPSPEKLLSEADKFSDEFKNQIYYSAAEKAAQNGNLAQAQKIIQSKLPEAEGESYLTQINQSVISQAITNGKFDEANALINQTPADNTRFYLLISLATSIYQKNPAGNKKQSLGVLEQARALIPQPSETLEDMSSLVYLATTLAEIEPEQSFQIVESLVYPINEFVEASAVVGKYRNDGTLRQGEMLVNNYGAVNGLSSVSPIITTIKKNDPKRTLNFINNFQRLEVRIGLQMLLIDDSAPADASPSLSATPSIGITVNRRSMEKK